MLGEVDVGDVERALELVVEVADLVALALGFVALGFGFLFAGEGTLPLIHDAGKAEDGDEDDSGDEEGGEWIVTAAAPGVFERADGAG